MIVLLEMIILNRMKKKMIVVALLRKRLVTMLCKEDYGGSKDNSLL